MLWTKKDDEDIEQILRPSARYDPGRNFTARLYIDTTSITDDNIVQEIHRTWTEHDDRMKQRDRQFFREMQKWDQQHELAVQRQANQLSIDYHRCVTRNNMDLKQMDKELLQTKADLEMKVMTHGEQIRMRDLGREKELMQFVAGYKEDMLYLIFKGGLVFCGVVIILILAWSLQDRS